jgi:hypothetical protein
LCVAGGVVGVAMLAMMVFPMFGNSPFVMHVTPDGTRSLVEFRYPDEGLVSPRFEIATTIPQGYTLELASDDLQVPNGSIQFADVTVFPGQFKIRLGGSHFDVMPARIFVDGSEYDWLPAPGG